MSNIGKSHLPCQCCGSADHQSNACLQAQMCPTCMQDQKPNFKVYLFHVKEVIIKIKRTYRGYGYDDPPEQVPQINGRVRDVQVTPIVDKENVHFVDEFLLSRRTHGTQEAVLGHNDFSKEAL